MSAVLDRARPQARTHALIPFLLCQEISAQLDAWSYEQRLQDATHHSRRLAKEVPVGARSALFHPYRRRSVRDDSREAFLRALQRIDEDEYGAPAPPADPLASFRRQSSAIAQRLAAALEQRVATGSGRLKMGGDSAEAAKLAAVRCAVCCGEVMT